MIAVVEIIAPVFVIILLGYGLGHTRLFEERDARVLIGFVWYVAIPALLFRALAPQDLPSVSELLIVIAYYLSLYLLYGAALLIARGDTDEALIVLGKLGRTGEVERLEAAARVQANHGVDLSDLEARVVADPGDDAARVDLGQALAANGEYEPALDHLLEAVRTGGEHREAARQAMVDVFGLLGPSHPLTASYRRALANALF